MATWLRIEAADAILDPAAGLDTRGDVWVRDGTIVSAGGPPPTLAPDEEITTVDARGCLVAPLFIDIHVHLREPGGEQAETIATGAASAWAGGYGRVYAMANTNPVCDRPDVVHLVRDAAHDVPVDVVPIGALSQGLRGRDLVDFEALAAAGAAAFSDDGAWLADANLVKQAFRWSARNGVPVFQHCEDFERTGPGVMHACACVHDAGLPGIPSASEVVAIERDIGLAAAQHAALHVCHISTEGGVAAIRAARARGEPITAEVTPHHLVLTAADAVAGGPDFKMKPPLRDPSDVDALIDGLVDGTIGALATDHAPHTAERKAAGIERAPFGVVGLETAVPVVFSALVAPGRLSLKRLVEVLTTGPAEIAGCDAPGLAAGTPARFSVIDLETARTVDRARLQSRSGNTPFHGRTLRGWPVLGVSGDRLHRHVVDFDERIRTSRADPSAGQGSTESPQRT